MPTRASYMRLKETAYNRLGGFRCVGIRPSGLPCGETERALLTIDHINGTGAAERKLIGRGADAAYREVMKAPVCRVREEYQVLCWNCQIRKRDQNKEYRAPSLRKAETFSEQLSLWDDSVGGGPTPFNAPSGTNAASLADNIAAFRDMMRLLELQKFLQGVPSGAMDMEPTAPVLAGKELTEQPTFWDS